MLSKGCKTEKVLYFLRYLPFMKYIAKCVINFLFFHYIDLNNFVHNYVKIISHSFVHRQIFKILLKMMNIVYYNLVQQIPK